MRLRFIHAADIHLGYEQYNLPKRADDFARAFFAVVGHTKDVQADFLLLAGDLFHRASADAWMLKQATHGLSELRDAGIPVVVIEGNHDAQFVRKNLSWLEFLSDQGLLHLLNIRIGPRQYKSVEAWNEENRRGAYIDLAGARIYGMKYYGAATAHHLEEVQDQIEPGEYTILMLHAGMEGQVPHLHGGLTHGQVRPLHESVDYLALGHIHKRLQDDWIYNPGSTETNSMEEIEWPHGFFDVQVDTDTPEKHLVRAVDTPDRRPFHRLAVSADGCRSLDEFVARVEEEVAGSTGIRHGAVIELVLAGVAEFRRQDVPLERLKGAVELRHQPLVARVRNALVPPGIVSVRQAERAPRTELEREIIEKLVYQQAEYRDRADAWARLVLDIKNMAVEDQPPASIVDHIQSALATLDSAPPNSIPQQAWPLFSLDDANGDGRLEQRPDFPGQGQSSGPPAPVDSAADTHHEAAPDGRTSTATTVDSGTSVEINAPITIAGDPIDAPPDIESW
jgi:DNA repair exonuclease SbcCD nuclease subunit